MIVLIKIRFQANLKKNVRRFKIMFYNFRIDYLKPSLMNTISNNDSLVIYLFNSFMITIVK